MKIFVILHRTLACMLGVLSLSLLFSVCSLWLSLSIQPTENENKGVCHTVALPFTINKYLIAKEE